MAFGENDIKMSSIGALAGSTKDLKLKELAKNVVSPWSKSKPHDGEYAANNDGEAYGVKLLSASTPKELYDLVKNGDSYKLTNPITDSSKNIRLGDFRLFNYNNTYIPLGHLYENGSNISLTEEGDSLLVNVIADCKYQNAVEDLDNNDYENTLISREDLFNNYLTKFNRGVYFHAESSTGVYNFWCIGSLPYIGDLPFIDENNNEIKLDPVLDKDGWRSLIGESGNEIEVYAMEFISDVPKNSFGTNTALNNKKFYAIPNSIHSVKLTGEWNATIEDPLGIYDGSLKITSGLKTSTAKYSFSITYGKNNGLLVDNRSIECKNIKSYLYNSAGTLLHTIEHSDMTISPDIVTTIYSGSYESPAINESSYVVVTWEANGEGYEERIDSTTSLPVNVNITNARFQPPINFTGNSNAEIKFDMVVRGDQNTNYIVNCMITYDPLGVNSNNTVIYNESISITTDANGNATKSISLTANLNALSPNASAIFIQPSIEGQEGLFAKIMVIFDELTTTEE